MPAGPPLQPTLWRSCRVLANRPRLRLLRLLVVETELCVTLAAQRLSLPLPVASQYLRALEARTFLQARRRGRRVFYRLPPLRVSSPLQPLLQALHQGFPRDPDFAEAVYRFATAFTHPRRIEVYRALGEGPQTLPSLRARTGVSRFALVRHLHKLEARGFIRRQADGWCRTTPKDALRQALARLAQA